MASYLLLYSGGSGMPQSEAEQKAIIDDWTAWYTRLGQAVVDPGNPTSPVAKSIDSNGKVSDGRVGSMVTGYTILKADSLDAAVALAKGCPVEKQWADFCLRDIQRDVAFLSRCQFLKTTDFQG